jgi:hypothetical protein
MKGEGDEATADAVMKITKQFFATDRGLLKLPFDFPLIRCSLNQGND